MDNETTKQLIDIVDTSVKVGLGAFVSGLITYIITKSNHKHDLAKDKDRNKNELFKDKNRYEHDFNKEKFNHKMIMLNQATDIVEDYFTSVHKLFDEYYGVAHKDIGLISELSTASHDKLLLADKNYLENALNVQHGIAKFQILGLKTIVDSLYSFDNTIVEYRNKLMLEKKVFFSAADISAVLKDKNMVRESIYSQITDYFEDLK